MTTTVFASPVFLPTLNRVLPAGAYEMETEEETLEGVTQRAYRRVEVRLFAPRGANGSGSEMHVLSPAEFDDAVSRDRKYVLPRQGEVVPQDRTKIAAAKLLRDLAVPHQTKRGNGPLYGACAGVAALLIATYVAHQNKAINQSYTAARMQESVSK
jgi:hypothetical protein